MSVSCSVIKLKFLRRDVWNRTTDLKWYIQNSLCVVCSVVVAVVFCRCWHDSSRRVSVDCQRMKWNEKKTRAKDYDLVYISHFRPRKSDGMPFPCTSGGSHKWWQLWHIHFILCDCVCSNNFKDKTIFQQSKQSLWFFLDLIAAFPFFKPFPS